MSNGAVGNAVGQPLGSGVQLHKSGLLFTGKQSLTSWEQVGSRLFSFADSSTWWIADWLVYGESTFQDRYEEAIKRTSLSYQTLRNYTWVARAFPISRRRLSLSFSHHLEVVALEQPEQDYWLRKAEEQSWSRNRLRAEVRSSLLARHGEIAGPARAVGQAVEALAENHAESGVIERAEPRAAATTVLLPADQSAEARQLRLQLSAEDLAQLELAARKQSEPLETWAAQTLRRAASGS